jgi:uncharacterized protein YjiS (DUF1127 family)
MHKRIAAMQHQRFKFRSPTPISASYPKRQELKTDDETRNTMNLIRNYRNWRRYRETVSELNRLSTRELNDLGISRGDIPYVARKSL